MSSLIRMSSVIRNETYLVKYCMELRKHLWWHIIRDYAYAYYNGWKHISRFWCFYECSLTVSEDITINITYMQRTQSLQIKILSAIKMPYEKYIIGISTTNSDL